MKILIAILIMVAGLSKVEAQTVRVIKAKGNRAVVQFPRGTNPQKGDTYDLGGGDSYSSTGSSSGSSGGGSTGPRDNTIGAAFELSSLSSDGNSSTTFSLAGYYGWVYQSVIEFGPKLVFYNRTSDNFTVRSLLVGGFFDYNLVPNIPANELVYGPTTNFSIGTASSGNTSTSAFNWEGGAFLKWFLLKTPTCLRGDAALAYYRTSRNGGGSDTTTGLKLTAGLQVYF